MGFGGGSSGLAGANPTFIALDNHVASIAEATYTYTPSTALDFATYSKIIVEFDGAPTGALTLLMRINGNAGVTNWSEGFRATGGALVNIAVNGTADLQIASATLTSIFAFGGTIELKADNIEVTNNLHGYSVFRSGTVNVVECMGLFLNAVASKTITSIEIKTSASTWKIGTRITIYGVKKT